MKSRTLIATGIGLGALLFTAGAVGLVHSRKPTAAVAVVAAPGGASSLAHISGATLEQTISRLQDRLKATPKDFTSWSTLGLAYIQHARTTVNSDFYPRADGALQKSLSINSTDNYLAYAGLAALANARHDFVAAKAFAKQGLVINSYSDVLYGALSDAETQLGDYRAAFADVQKMVDLSPDTSSLSRASYTWELRGNTDEARTLMRQALNDAPNGSNRAFALFYLGELAFNSGDVNGALALYRQALQAAPQDSASLAGKAKAEAALGQTQTAIDDYTSLVQRTPEPSYLVEFGELLDSLGRHNEANQQYAIVEATQKLFEANGVKPDSTQTLFYADHGEPTKSLASAERGIATRPFLAMYDAYAWALHVNGRDAEALVAVDKALETGMRNALYHFHKAMIELALGDRPAARQALTEAISINPTFSPLAAPIAAATLAELGAES